MFGLKQLLVRGFTLKRQDLFPFQETGFKVNFFNYPFVQNHLGIPIISLSTYKN